MPKLNVIFTRLGARKETHQSSGQKYDAAHAAALAELDRVQDDEWRKGVMYPNVDVPFLGRYITIEKVFRSHVLHFAEHAAQIRTGPGSPQSFYRVSTSESSA